MGIDTYGIAGYGGVVISGTWKSNGLDTSFTVTVGNGGSGAPSGTNAANFGGAGSGSALVGNSSFAISAGGGNRNLAGFASAVSTWAGTFSGQGQNGNRGGGGPGGLTCWWDSVGFPTLCAGGTARAGFPGSPGIVVVREAITSPVFTSGSFTYTTTSTHHIYTFTTGGYFTL